MDKQVSLNRRDFGKRVLQVAAAAGLRAVDVRRVLQLGLPLGAIAGCRADIWHRKRWAMARARAAQNPVVRPACS